MTEASERAGRLSRQIEAVIVDFDQGTLREFLRATESYCRLSSDWLRLPGIRQLYVHPHDPFIELLIGIAFEDLRQGVGLLLLGDEGKGRHITPRCDFNADQLRPRLDHNVISHLAPEHKRLHSDEGIVAHFGGTVDLALMGQRDALPDID